jgi:hypothetical protein
MTSIEQILLQSTRDEHREAFDYANTHTSSELLKDMEYRRVGGIAIAIARPFEGPSLDETIEAGDAPIVRFLPWGNNATKSDFNQPAQTQLLANVANRPIIAMSSPSVGSTLKLSRRDRKYIQDGDFSPVAREMLASLDELTEGKLARVAFMGASQGAAFGIATASEALRRDHFETVEGVLALGLPNVRERGRPELLNDFSKAGTVELHETLVRGGVPQLVTANHLSLHEPKRPLHFSMVTTAKMSRHPILGYALSGGMGKIDTMWQRDIPTILRNSVPLTLVSEGQGAIMPTESLQARVAELEAGHEELGLDEAMLRRLGLVSIVDGNHTLADHMPTVAALLDRIS